MTEFIYTYYSDKEELRASSVKAPTLVEAIDQAKAKIDRIGGISDIIFPHPPPAGVKGRRPVAIRF